MSLNQNQTLQPIDEDALEDLQINQPPSTSRGLWTVVTRALRCPNCGSQSSKAYTGKRRNSKGFIEHYRSCTKCRARFRVVYE